MDTEFTPSPEMIETLAFLRDRLGEKGFLITPTVAWYRRREEEFLAIPQSSRELDNSNQFLLIRPMRGGWIKISSFSGFEIHRHLLADILERNKKHCAVPIRTDKRLVRGTRGRKMLTGKDFVSPEL